MYTLLIGAAFLLVFIPLMSFIVFWRNGVIMSVLLVGGMFLTASYMLGTLILEIKGG